MNKKKLILTLLLVIILSIGLIFTIVGCDKTPLEPVFEIKLYDDNWVELRKQNNISYANYENYVVQYDGTPKLCNAIVFKNGEEFYKLDYKKNGNFYYDYILEVYLKKTEWSFGGTIEKAEDIPVNPGEYKITFEYNSYGYRNNLNEFANSPLPKKYYSNVESIVLIINE